MTSRTSEFDLGFQALVADVASAIAMETALGGKGSLTIPKLRGRQRKTRVLHPALSTEPRDPVEIAEAVLTECNRKRKAIEDDTVQYCTDEEMFKMARFTDKFNLRPYERFLHYVPRLVNVVTLAEAIPVSGSGITLPLDLHRIAARCRNSYYAPKKFSAVQLAYSEPRCRVLVFHTGRLVGTGTSGPMAARIALLRAQKQLYEDADVNIHVRNFAVINQVGAFNLKATLNCEAFATEHSSTAHFDAKSFVGLAWRPAGESVCCEIYGTGRANIPGSVVERQLQDSVSRMFPELLRFSSSSRLLSIVSDELQWAHRPKTSAPATATLALLPTGRARMRDIQMTAPAQPLKPKRCFRPSVNVSAKPGVRHCKSAPVVQQPQQPPSVAPLAQTDVWDGWADGVDGHVAASSLYNIDDSDDDLDLAEMGL